MTELSIDTTSFKSLRDKASPRRRSRGQRGPAPDLVIATGDGATETVRLYIQAKAQIDGLRVEAQISDGEDWTPVAVETLAEGLTLMLQHGSRVERTAARYGLAIESLLAALEDSVVDVTDETAGLPQAEQEALTMAGIDLRGSDSDPSGAAQVALGLARFHQFRTQALSVAEAARLLGVSDGRVRQQVTAGTILSIPNGEGGHLLPSWQFIDGQLVPGLKELAPVALEVHPLTLAGFMTRADVDLEVDGEPVTPREWLLGGGDPGAVADLAAGLSIAA